MSQTAVTYVGGSVFDGRHLLQDHTLRLEGGILVELAPADDAKRVGEIVDLKGAIVAPGFVDLQVNGGDGLMFNDAPTVQTLKRMVAAHRRLGATTILPTLITDTAEKTTAAIGAARQAIAAGVSGVGGLHLEGPHLSVARKGAHDAGLIRPMDQNDLQQLLSAAADLPALMVTIAPENVSPDQVAALSQAGVVVSLGHTDADYQTSLRYARAGARCATHLFNAMSQLGNREPGLVGAVLSTGGLSAGLIADGIHVHPQTMRAAWAAKVGPGRIFLVSDAMAVAGTDATEFELEGRRITRQEGRLTLADGTLAGADLDLTTALRVLVQEVGVGLETALRAVTSVPAALMGFPAQVGNLVPGQICDLICLTPDLTEVSVL